MKAGMRETDTHIYFWGSVFSNFAPVLFVIDFVAYTSVEQYFMSRKAAMFGDFETLGKIMKAEHPAEQKKLGREVKGFNGEIWDYWKYKVMIDGTLAKFTSSKHLTDTMLDTHDKVLVEASPTDLIWGVGLHYNDDKILDKDNWRGQNQLGKALMHIRRTIRSKHGTEPNN